MLNKNEAAPRKIMVIAAERLTRAYLGAQLEEDGFAVRRSADIVEASRTVREWAVTPDLVVVDARGLRLRQEGVDVLNRLCPGVPLLLIHGGWDSPESLIWTGRVYELPRPVSVAQVVDRAKTIIADQRRIAD